MTDLTVRVYFFLSQDINAVMQTALGKGTGRLEFEFWLF